MDKLFLKIHTTLPIFKIEHNLYQIIYTPGSFFVLNNVSFSELKEFFTNPSVINDLKLQRNVLQMLNIAKKNKEKWDQKMKTDFSPECLTIHVGNECNLNCEYCYSKAPSGGILTGFPKLMDIKKAFEFLLKNNKNLSQPIPIVFHGSGEPSFHWEQLKKAHIWLSGTAKRMGHSLFFYLATNGYLRKEQVDWLADNINLIGISCDGPPNIHQRQRGKMNHQYLTLEETCRIFLLKKANFDIRVTITSETISKQLEIVKYIIDNLHAKRIRIEPVYLFKKGIKAEKANEFLSNFIEAQNYADRHRVFIEYSGVRIHEQHGTFCDVSRNTIRLTPEGYFRNCFCKFNHKEDFILGEIDSISHHVIINKQIQEIKQKAFKMPEYCKSCINIYHCSRGCPDYCVYDKEIPSLFKCRLNQLIAMHQIKQLVDLNNYHNE